MQWNLPSLGPRRPVDQPVVGGGVSKSFKTFGKPGRSSLGSTGFLIPIVAMCVELVLTVLIKRLEEQRKHAYLSVYTC